MIFTNMGVEIWREFHEFDGRYFTSTSGRVKCISRCGENIKKPQDNGNGYSYVQTLSGKKRKNYYIHIIVAESFLKNEYNYPQVNHLDFDRSNGFLWNVEWSSIKDNMNYSIINGRFLDANKKQSEKLKNKCINGTNPLLNLSNEDRLKSLITRKNRYKKENHGMYGVRYVDNPQSKPIIQLSLNGEFIKRWSCAAEIQDVLGFFSTSVGKCCLGKLRTSHGFIWRFADN